MKRKYRVRYRDDSPGSPVFSWVVKAHDREEAEELFWATGSDDGGWKIVSIKLAASRRRNPDTSAFTRRPKWTRVSESPAGKQRARIGGARLEVVRSGKSRGRDWPWSWGVVMHRGGTIHSGGARTLDAAKRAAWQRAADLGATYEEPAGRKNPMVCQWVPRSNPRAKQTSAKRAYTVEFWSSGSWMVLSRWKTKAHALAEAERRVSRGDRILTIGVFTPAGNNVVEWWDRGGNLNTSRRKNPPVQVCGGRLRQGPKKAYVVCSRCGRKDYEKYEGDRCTRRVRQGGKGSRRNPLIPSILLAGAGAARKSEPYVQPGPKLKRVKAKWQEWRKGSWERRYEDSVRGTVTHDRRDNRWRAVVTATPSPGYVGFVSGHNTAKAAKATADRLYAVFRDKGSRASWKLSVELDDKLAGRTWARKNPMPRTRKEFAKWIRTRKRR